MKNLSPAKKPEFPTAATLRAALAGRAKTQVFFLKGEAMRTREWKEAGLAELYRENQELKAENEGLQAIIESLKQEVENWQAIALSVPA